MTSAGAGVRHSGWLVLALGCARFGYELSEPLDSQAGPDAGEPPRSGTDAGRRPPVCPAAGCVVLTHPGDAGLDADPGSDASSASDASLASDASPATDAGFPVVDAAPPTGCSLVVADSVADFSPVQGQGGWQFGYYEAPNFGAGDFLRLPLYEYVAQLDEFIWRFGDSAWTHMGARRSHPNGELTTGGLTPIDQYAVRRWTSAATETLFVQGSIYALDASSNGVVGRIRVGDAEIWQHRVAPGESTPFAFQVLASVQVGDSINFIVEPYQSDDASDATAFEAQICR